MFVKLNKFMLVGVLVVLIYGGCAGAAGVDIPHLKKAGRAVQLIVDNEPYVMLAGEVHNSSSSSLEYMEPLWDKFVSLNLNTVLTPVSWQLIEPEEGRFDFTLVDGLISGAREHNLRLVLLWFGSWKNTISCYVPDWVKKDTERFWRIERDSPRELRERWGFGKIPEVISALCEEAWEADKRAFAALMRHLRQVDGDRHTVIMVQVENETGLIGDSRDRSAAAEKAFSGQVPKELMRYLERHKDTLIPELHKIWSVSGFRKSGTWTEVFGSGPEADEVFMAWHTGRYVDAIAAAGKAEYPLAMFANAWLIREELNELPGEYPSGGPVSKMMDVWRAAAPNIDILAPDIYWPYFKSICAKYTRSGNPLLIPEAKRDDEPERKVLYAVGEHDALCYAPFGIDNKDFSSEHPLAQSNKMLSEIMDLIIKNQGTGNMRAFLEYEEEGTTVDIGRYRFNIDYDVKEKVGSGCGLIILLSEDEYLISGLDFKMTFGSNDKELPRAGVLSVEEGRYEKGRWLAGRRLNGDEIHHGSILFARRFSANQMPLFKVRFYCY